MSFLTEAAHGWLAADPEAPATLAAVSFDGTFPTRREEYGFVHDRLAALTPGRCYDAGTGYNPAIHVMPYIAANLGWMVEAGDIDLRQFALPFHPRVRRTFCNLGATPFPDGVMDAVLCVSTLEHVSADQRLNFVNEAFRLLRPGGAILITTDETDPEIVASWFPTKHFDVGERQPDPETHLSPRVAYLAAFRR